MEARRFWAGLQLLDRQLLDRDGHMAGNVDDIELERDPDTGTLRISAILSGPGALAGRFGWHRLSPWLRRVHREVTPLGGDPTRVNPLAPAELVIDHSVIADVFGSPEAFERNVEIEYERNRERYQFLRWGQGAFADFKVVPPGTGIVHQVNIEHLARTVFTREVDGVTQAYPDTCVGTDSHTTMVNGIGVVGWGVGGIEAEAAMLGQPVSMLIPRVVGFKLSGELPEGSTATDLVLTITEMLRKHGVVGKFVEFYGEGVSALPLANRATIGNMSPEFGSTCAIFPIDGETVKYLELTGRSKEQLALVEAYAKEQGLWHDPSASDYVEPRYSEKLELDLATVVPSLAGPKRPQDRVEVSEAKASFREALTDYVQSDEEGYDEAVAESFPASDAPATSNGHEAAPAGHPHGSADGRPSNLQVVGNVFGPCSFEGPKRGAVVGWLRGNGNVWRDNFWDDGTAIPEPETSPYD